MRARVEDAVRHAAGLSAVLAPFAICIAAGAVHASLWLDEITYWYFERSDALRGLEMRRPGSTIAPYFLNYFYCDIQRGVHWVLNLFGFTLQDDPELYLRFLSLVCFAAIGVLTYFVTLRETKTWWFSVAAALVVSASPLLLFYAFEARVSAFAALGVMVYLVLLGAALRRPHMKGFWIAGAVLSIFLTHLHAWIVCLYAGLCIAAFVRSLGTRAWRELIPVAAFAIPGAITVAAESIYIIYSYPPGGHAFPLYAPRPMWMLQEKTFAGTFSAGSALPAFFKPFWFVPSIPLLLLTALLVLLVFQLRRSSNLIFPVAAVISLWVSIFLGARYGFLIAPRYQVPLFAALFFSLRLAPTGASRVLVAAIGLAQLALLPNAIADIHAKGNGKDIATLIETTSPRNRTAVVVQHTLRMGYPDPLHNFVLQFYLDEVDPTGPVIPIYELPELRNITGKQGLREYFGGGEPLLNQYAAIQDEYWLQQIPRAPYERIWLVTPVPEFKPEHQQAKAFRAALEKSGYTQPPQHMYRFSGYPPTYVALYVRSDRHNAAGVAKLPLERVPDLGTVGKAGDENRSATAAQR